MMRDVDPKEMYFRGANILSLQLRDTYMGPKGAPSAADMSGTQETRKSLTIRGDFRIFKIAEDTNSVCESIV